MVKRRTGTWSQSVTVGFSYTTITSTILDPHQCEGYIVLALDATTSSPGSVLVSNLIPGSVTTPSTGQGRVYVSFYSTTAQTTTLYITVTFIRADVITYVS